MSYPKDPYYEKNLAASSAYYPATGQVPPGQYVPPGYPAAPPPYSAVASAGPTYQPVQYSYGPGVPPQPQPCMVATAPSVYPGYSQPTYNPGYPVQQGFNYSVPPLAVAQFDAGARFDGIASQNIPPPPPGYAPNAAQMVAAQGGTVVATQKKAGWFSGTGGGVTLW